MTPMIFDERVKLVKAGGQPPIPARPAPPFNPLDRF